MLGSRSGYVRRVEDIAGNGAGLAVGADWRAGGAVGGTGRRALGCAAGFDIPAQDLRAALEAFDTATGISVLYGSDLSAGRRSSALRGHCAGRGAASVAGGHGPDRAGGRRQGFRAAAHAQRAVRRRGVGAGAASPGLRGAVAAARAGRPVPAAGQRAGHLPRGAGAAGRPARSRSVRCACWIPRAARRATRRYARGLQGLPVGEPSGDPGKAYVVLVLPRESRKPADCASAPACSLAFLAPCTSADERSRILRVARPDRAALRLKRRLTHRLGSADLAGEALTIPGCVLNSRSPTGRRRRR